LLSFASSIAFTGMAKNCDGLFNLSSAVLDGAAKDAVAQGNDIAGSETFIKLMLRNLEQTKQQIASSGPIKWCLTAEARIRRLGFNVLQDKPSFDCAKTTTSSEQTICHSPDLIANDRAILSLYRVALRTTGGDPQTIKNAQRQWIAMRQACLSDEQCLRSAYQMRIQQLANTQ
jgi:uncharacterized protein YecT (DUF1311 family)